METSKPIVPWVGGKRRLAKKILPLFPKHTAYVEPFCGGAALFFLKDESKVEVLNDLNGELVNLYRIIKHHLEEFLRHFKWSLVSRADYLLAQQVRPETLTDVQRAARFYYLQKLAFGAKVVGQNFGYATSGKPHLNLLRMEEELSAAHLRLARVYIENLPWWDCIERYDREESLFYCDPPYWSTVGYGIDFGLAEYERMATMARSIKGRMIISVGDCREMRKAFKGLRTTQLDINYTVGGTQKPATELLITNW